MFGNLSGPTLLVILFIVLLLFGAPKLPALAKSLGQSMKILKKEVTSNDDERKAESVAEEPEAPAAPAAPVVPPAPAAPAVSAEDELAKAKAEAAAAKAEAEALRAAAEQRAAEQNQSDDDAKQA